MFLFCFVFCSLKAWSTDLPSRQTMKAWCQELSVASKKLKWDLEPCEGLDWKIGGYSIMGRPLPYISFGPETAKNATLILSTVHGDEITPVFLGLRLVQWLKEHEGTLDERSRILVAPLINPDGFYARSRMNARKVDINRNFPTKGWDKLALGAWKTKYQRNPRRYPGATAGSEPETVFQQDLIRLWQPKKILSVHSPLNYLDYDGPSSVSLRRFPLEYAKECERLKLRLKAKSGGFFPGSLGNYAGHERGIPTLTLELPSANPQKALTYWELFKTGIRTMIDFEVAHQGG
jgi:murein peptide amidase A